MKTKKIRAAKVEYTDDDGYDQKVIIAIGADDTEDTIEDNLYDQGFTGCWVDRIIENYGVCEAENYKAYDIIKVF